MWTLGTRTKTIIDDIRRIADVTHGASKLALTACRRQAGGSFGASKQSIRQGFALMSKQALTLHRYPA